MQLSHDEAKLLTGFILSEYERERTTTAKVLEAIPSGKEDYAPDPKSMGALKLAWHIAGSELYFFEGAIQGAFPKSEPDPPASIHGIAGLLAWYNAKLPAQIDKAKSLSGEALSRLIDFHGIMKIPAYAVLQLMLKHSIHHRGQLSTYLRPMGGKVPSIYGPSADTK
ncbi:MAG: DinB family protein [Bryobacteraceae bacterium]